MASYERQVYYTKIDYERKMNDTKELFIKDKYDGVSTKTFKEKIGYIWVGISHEYMEKTIQDQMIKTMNEDHVTMKQQQSLSNRYKLNPISKFTDIEEKYAKTIVESYANIRENNTEFLTKILKDFSKAYERTIPYYPHGNKSEKPISMHTPAEYLSMLYNVNLRMASWNQTIKDGEVLGIDLVELVPHPNGCEDCSSQMGQIFSISGYSKRYKSIEWAYEHGVGHPNCKCDFSLVWDNTEIVTDPIVDLYEPVQKGRAINRDLNSLAVDYDLYRYIGNYGEADKTLDKMNKLQDLLNELLILYDISSYIF